MVMQVEEVKISDIENHPNNPKIHEDKQIRLIEKSIKKFGYTNPVILSADGIILAGHARVKAAIQMGQDTIPAIRTKLTGKDADAYLIADNRLTELAQYDRDILSDLLSDLPADLVDLTGFDSVQVDALLAGEDIPEIEKFISDSQPEEPREEVGAEPQIDRAAELNKKWQVQPGDLWQCGDHRLICGDCTDSAVVERVMMGEKADMVFTSPPYNQGGKAKRLPAFYGGNGDNKTKDEYAEFIINTLKVISCISKDDTPILWNVSYNANSRDDYGRLIFSDYNPFHVMETIIWDKKHGFNISARGILSRDSEFIFLMVRGEDYYTNQGRYDTWYNTWRISTNGSQTEGHGAAFPIGLPIKGIESFCIDVGLVFEPFLGSGTTLIACENTGRKCRGIEISPDYCAVVLERFKEATGKEPVKING